MPSTRRTLLTSVGAAVTSMTLAGCSQLPAALGPDPEPDEPPESGVERRVDPGDHILGADGDWSSFGCNAANTRAVADGQAPVDGVSERWRADVAQLGYRAPVVAGGRVYHPDGRRLRVFDAADGTELWTLEDSRVAPLVRDGVVYVPVGTTLYALEADTGDELWNREFETRGSVTTPTTYEGRQLVCGAGERVVSLDPETAEIRWEREVFGQVLDHLAVFQGYGFVVATEAGEVSLFSEEGTGWRRWELPSTPTCPPSADTDSIYVTCRNGTTYALMDDGLSDPEITWTDDTGWAERGIGVVDDLVLVANGRGLHAVDAESGEHRWEYDTGDWRHTAPAYGRDTLFVGGDRLWAVDPTPGDSPDGGPAVRFERKFAGRVGLGPVLDDGTLYVVAEVEDETFALLALD
ncbi:PQQ-binding-like beta-propeller repeat protein [Natrinema versiforme]|uniref:Pyrrolo-quinoline quinone n=1 Tax=Natrinema versiforme TaxID=88724 RepID=A0A4P8WGJ8_9EURY|nr:PQQ-binding-like beta-propeller repeat protein [Natrinema versiforme]QCS42205.1 pyrrolo-quinoline quinone [Natrinema versiforme]